MFKSMEEFDHHSIDEYGNVENNYYKNLRWCEQADNLKYGYERRKDTPFRNYRPCKLYVGNKLIDEFLSITEAVDYAEKHYNVKRTMLHKHLVYKNVRIERCND